MIAGGNVMANPIAMMMPGKNGMPLSTVFSAAIVNAIERRANVVERADTICYATKENQDAARLLASDPEVDVIVVIGGKKSANTKHLWEICRESKRSYLVQGATDLEPAWFQGANVVGVTAGSSTPDYVIDEVEARIVALA